MGHVYEGRSVRNGMRLRVGTDPCAIMVSSPNRGDRQIILSWATVVVLATEVLQGCDTGGAYTFRGTWRVAVTRLPIDGRSEG